MLREEHELLRLVDSIFANRGLRVRIEGPQCLRDEKIYIQMCKILFPSQNIKLIRLSSRDMPTGAKIQALIDYISQETGMELSHISGEAIARGHITDIFNILQFLEEVSHHILNSDGQPCSAPQSAQAVDNDPDDFHTVQGIDKEFHKQQNGFNQVEKKKVKKKEQLKEDPSPSNSVDQDQRNFQQEILNEVRKAKQQLLKTSILDNRKDLNGDIKKIKNQYKAYLKDLIVDKKVQENIKQYKNKKPKIKKNKTVTYDVVKEIEQANNTQKSMAFKLRDNKQRYIRKIKQLVHHLQRQRIQQQSRQQRIIQKEIDRNTRNRMQSLQNQHDRNSGVLKQKTQQTRGSYNERERENRKLISESHRRLKQHFQTERNHFHNHLHQQNNRLFNVFEDEGIQQIIVEMYKKY